MGGRGLGAFKVGSNHRHGTMAIAPSTVVEESISAGGVMDMNAALQEVLKTTLTQDSLAKGNFKATKPHLFVFASNSDESLSQVGEGPCDE